MTLLGRPKADTVPNTAQTKRTGFTQNLSADIHLVTFHTANVMSYWKPARTRLNHFSTSHRGFFCFIFLVMVMPFLSQYQ